MALLTVFAAALLQAQSVTCPSVPAPLGSTPEFFDDPQFIVAGVADNTYRGGHGSDAVLRSTDDLAKATASLGGETSPVAAEDARHKTAIDDEHNGRSLQAAQEFQRAAESNPSEPNLFDWGAELLVHRAAQPAAEVFTKGTRLYPQSIRMRLGLAAAWYSAGCYEQAASYFFQAVDLAPANPDPYFFLSKVQRSEITAAPGYLERMARFLKLQPNNALANYYYALAIWKQPHDVGDSQVLRKAAELLKEAIKLDPRLGPAYLELGAIYMGERQYPEAIRKLRKAIGVAPDLEEAHYRLSEAYRRTGQLGEAHRELEVYKQLSAHSAQEVERERKDIQQFIVKLRAQPAQ